MHRLRTLMTTAIAIASAASALADPRPSAPPADVLMSRPSPVPHAMGHNFLANPNFDMPAATGWVVNRHEHPGDGVEGGGGPSAAPNWTSWVAAPGPGDVSSEVVPSSLTHGKMIHVKVNGAGAGLVQTALAAGTGPEKAYLCAWVMVVRGRVGIGAGNGGHTAPSTYSTTLGKWERLEARNGVSPANEFIVYGDPGSEFFVENAVFSDIWPPSGCIAR